MNNTKPSSLASLHLRLPGPVPSKKNTWSPVINSRVRKPNGQPVLMIIQDRRVRQWCDDAVRAIELQLRSICEAAGFGTTPECLKQFATSSLPLDDDWLELEIGGARSEYHEAGDDYCEIKIERLC